MAKITFEGLVEYRDAMENLAQEVDAIVKMGIYDGADVIADEVYREIRALPTVDEYVLYEKQQIPIRGVTERQKTGLLNGLGLARMSERSGVVSTKVGIAGYNDVKTKKYPRGQPNALIARSVLRGTSYRLRDDFIGRAVRKARQTAIERMKATVDDQIKKRMK